MKQQCNKLQFIKDKQINKITVSIPLSKLQFIRAITSACTKDFIYFILKTSFFYFTASLLQNIQINLSILKDISIKYSFFSIFLLFLSTTLYISTISLSLSLSLSLYPFFRICCFLSLPISIPISEHRSPLPLGLIHTLSIRSPQTASLLKQDPISKQAPISNKTHTHSLNKTQSPLPLSQVPIKQNPQAPIILVKH